MFSNKILFFASLARIDISLCIWVISHKCKNAIRTSHKCNNVIRTLHMSTAAQLHSCTASLLTAVTSDCTRGVNYLLSIADLLSRAISYHDSYQTLRDRLCAIVLSKYKNQYKNPLLEFQ